ncbi:MAG TPA: GNAT family N-acetyltransferase [Fimbriimonadaceae bacterium]|nr:GNAT family N-acetyltransferase [Fimbriimonadaceae bacterium]
MEIEFHQLRPNDVPGAVALQRACFPPPFPEELLWQSAHLFRHLEVFPTGQFVATVAETVVGSASNLIISEANFQSHANWETTVGGHDLNAHDPCGSTLFGVDISVHPNFRGRGIARRLYAKRFEFVRMNSLLRYATACRLPDYIHSGVENIHEYVQAVVRGVLTDRTLTPLLKLGLEFDRVIENHMEDEESGNTAALLIWEP